MDKELVIRLIEDKIKENHNQEITGPILQNVLISMMSAISDGSTFNGIFTSNTPLPETTDVFYFATQSANNVAFNLNIPSNRFGVVSYDTSSAVWRFYDFTQSIQDAVDSVTDYSDLLNKPQINSVELSGNKTAAQLGLQSELDFDESPTEGSTNPVLSGGLYEAFGSLYKALSVAQNCLFGGLVTRLEAPSQGDDHRYYYITEQTGYFRYFDITLSDDSAATMIYWSDILSKWTIVGLWPTLAFVLKKANKVIDAVQGNLAGLDADGSLTDSGIAADNVATKQELAAKQDLIQDLDAIRSGAAAGATAVQESDIIPIESRLQNIEEEIENIIDDLAHGKLYGGIINTQSTVQPDTSCYYIAEEGGTYQAFGVTVNANERVQIIVHNGTSWEVVSLNMYNYGYAHGKFDKVDDIDSLLTDIVPSSASASNHLATMEDVERVLEQYFSSQS